MKIIKAKSMLFLLIFLFSITSIFPLIKEKRIYTFTDKNKNTEYTLMSVFKRGYVLSFYDDEFERIDKVGENENYFAIFFLSARNEKVGTLSIKNYYIINKNTNEIYRTSEKNIRENGIILKDVDIFLKEKGVLIYD